MNTKICIAGLNRRGGGGAGYATANYTIRNSLPGTTCDINLSQITLFIHGETTMLINNSRVFKIKSMSLTNNDQLLTKKTLAPGRTIS